MSGQVSLIDGHIDNAERCVCCGRVIPEGSQYCVICGNTEPKDMVEVVRCKDCIYFQPDFVLTNDGERRPYTQEEKESGFGYVSMEKGINCGSRCERHGYWEENKIPVWFGENDFCSYGELKECEGK
jgi:hypothetical protein